MMKECLRLLDHLPELNGFRGLAFPIGAIDYAVAEIEQDGMAMFAP